MLEHQAVRFIVTDRQTQTQVFQNRKLIKLGGGGGVVFKQKKTNKQKEEIKEQVLKL